MKKRLLAGVLALMMLASVLATTAFAESSGPADTSSPEGLSSDDIDISDIPVYEPGVYDLGDGTMLTVEHIPGMEAADEASVDSDVSSVSPDTGISDIPSGSADIDISDIPVYEPGVYDLGDGVTLTVEHIPGGHYDGSADKARLRQSFDNLPLTTSFKWVCSDDPLLVTNLKIYNNSSKNSGNIYGYISANDGAMGIKHYTAGIAPGDMATVTLDVLSYSVELSASVKGYYKVLITDWPL